MTSCGVCPSVRHGRVFTVSYRNEKLLTRPNRSTILFSTPNTMAKLRWDVNSCALLNGVSLNSNDLEWLWVTAKYSMTRRLRGLFTTVELIIKQLVRFGFRFLELMHALIINQPNIYIHLYSPKTVEICELHIQTLLFVTRSYLSSLLWKHFNVLTNTTELGTDFTSCW